MSFEESKNSAPQAHQQDTNRITGSNVRLGTEMPVGLLSCHREDRVPQYDLELKLAAEEIAKWKDIARRLYIARGCKKREHLRINAEIAYLKACNESQL